MLDIITKFTNRFARTQPAQELVSQPIAPAATHHVPVYPPTDPGIPFAHVDAIVASQSELIEKIMKAAALDSESQGFIMELIRNFAAYVHLLPATRAEQFPGNGGLFRMGLEVGFHVLRASHGVIFASEIAEVRVKTIPRWRIATFVAGLLSDTYRAVTTMHVFTADGVQWNPFVESLSEFLKRKGTQRYYLKWVKDAPEQQSFNSLVVGIVVPSSLLAYLAVTGPKIVGEMLEGIVGTGTTPLSRTIRTTREGLIKRDVLSNPNFIGRPMMGSHLEANLVDAMRRLIKEGKWKANENGQPLWNGADGLFLVIQAGWKDIYTAMQSGGFTGIPTDFEIIADVLLKAGVIVPSTDGYIHHIKLPMFEKRTLEAVRLSSGTKAFGDAFQGFAQLQDTLSTTPLAPPPKVVAPVVQQQPAPSRASLVPQKAVQQVAAAKPHGKGKAQVQDDADLPPDISEFLVEWVGGDDGEPMEEIPVVIGVEVDAPTTPGMLNGAVLSRLASRMQPDVFAWLESVVRGIVGGTIPFVAMGDAFGVPASLMDQASVNRGAVLSVVVRDGMIWIPPGQTKKLVDVDGEAHLFFNKRFIDEVTK